MGPDSPPGLQQIPAGGVTRFRSVAKPWNAPEFRYRRIAQTRPSNPGHHSATEFQRHLSIKHLRLEDFHLIGLRREEVLFTSTAIPTGCRYWVAPKCTFTR